MKVDIRVSLAGFDETIRAGKKYFIERFVELDKSLQLSFVPFLGLELDFSPIVNEKSFLPIAVQGDTQLISKYMIHTVNYLPSQQKFRLGSGTSYDSIKKMEAAARHLTERHGFKQFGKEVTIYKTSTGERIKRLPE